MSMFCVILVTTLLFASFACDEKEHSRVPRLHNDFHRLKKRQEVEGYMEQCRVTNLWKEQLGYVNVFAFLDTSWQYSYRQAIMLKLLKKGLEKASFSDVSFFVVAAPPDFPEDKTENDIEVEAWRKMSTFESHNFFHSAGMPFNNLTKETETDIVFIQDTPELGIWENIHASRNQILVIDRCGKLTYQVVVPWSILYFPYVKAAILSTYKDDPCGPCDTQSTSIYESMDYEEYLFGKATTKKEGTSEDLDLREQQNLTNAETESTTVSSNESTTIEDDRNITTTSFTDIDVNTDESTTPNIAITTALTEESETFYDSEIDTTRQQLEETTTTSTMAESVEKEDDLVTQSSTTFNVSDDSDSETTSIPELLSEQRETQVSSVIVNPTTTESYNEAEDRTLLNEPDDATNNNLLLTTSGNLDLNTSTENADEGRRRKLAVDSKTTGEREEISSVGHSTVVEDSEKKEMQVQLDESSFPMRIIMSAPHVHREDGTLKKYTSLVLKTGSPDYHAHYDFEKDMIPSDSQLVEGEKTDAAIQGKYRNKKISEYVYGQDESPGLYGEVADYWKNYDDTEYINKYQTTNSNNDYGEVVTTNKETHVNGVLNNESNLSKSSDADASNSHTEIKIDGYDDTTDTTQNTEDMVQFEEVNFSKDEDGIEVNNKEEEVRYKLIEHYSKLLPWIYYVLNK